MRTDGQTHELTDAFRNVGNAPTVCCTARSVFKETQRCLWAEMGRKIQTATDMVRLFGPVAT